VPCYRVFTQTGDGRIDLARLVTQARAFFEASIDVLGAEERVVRLRLQSEARGYAGTFAVHVRPATQDDYATARSAEARGRAAGMGTLAQRCGYIWDVEPDSDVVLAATLNLCALLASVALGPVLPPDADTLFGVRGAMERVEQLCGGRTLAR
jgi:hypothetical protein